MTQLSNQHPDPFAEAQKVQKEHDEKTKYLRESLLPILLAKGITTIHAEYHGFADEGMFDGISYEPQLTDKRKIADMQKLIDNPPAHRPNEEATKIVTVSNFLFAIVSQKFPGYENEEGGQGELTWNIEKDEININHEQNVVMTNRTIMEKI